MRGRSIHSEWPVASVTVARDRIPSAVGIGSRPATCGFRRCIQESRTLLCVALLSLCMGSGVQAESGSFVLRARCIMPVARDLPWEIENGVMVVREGRIVAVGVDIDIPPDLPIIDLPHATVVPGFVAAASDLAAAHRGDESIAAGYRAADAFDRYGNYARALADGITTVHLSPGNHRLLTGQGAVVKLGGDAAEQILRGAADLSVNLGAPKPPLDVTYSFPASADVPIPEPERQRPTSRMGQFLALEEAVRAAVDHQAGDHQEAEPLNFHRAALAQAWGNKLPLRVHADRAADLLGTVRFLHDWQRSGYVVGGAEADRVADALREAELPLVLQPRDLFAVPGGDVGVDPAALLVDRRDFAALQGVKIALAPGPGYPLRDLRLLAVRASRLGLGSRRAFEAITRLPAEILGVEQRVGSLEPGKDADFLVLTGQPLDVTTHVRRVFVNGQSVFQPPDNASLVIKAGVIWAKPDVQIQDGEILIENGKIVAVGTSVPHPRFARVIDAGPHGFVSPGFIDGFGHVGLGGDRTAVDNSLRLSKLFGAADVTDLRLCRAGITTVLVAPYAAAPNGSPLAAVKTAGNTRVDRVVGDPVSVWLDVSGSDPLTIAETLGKTLALGQKYLDAWTNYEKQLKEFLEKAKSGEQTKAADQQKQEEIKETKGPDPITGTWEVIVRGTPVGDEVKITMQMQLVNATINGRIIASSMGVTGTVSGTLAGKHASLVAEINHPQAPGPLAIEVDLTEEDHFRGTVSVQQLVFPLEGRRTDKNPVEIKVAQRRLRGKDGRPLPPKVDPALEPLKALLEKKIPVVVKVSSPAQIREVLDLLVDKHQLTVTLLDAPGAAVHAVRLADKKVAVILPPAIVRSRNYQDYLQADDLARQGVPIVFQSNVEDGARYLPAVVLYAVEQGLDAEKALAALTIDAARAFKIDSRVGSIEPGKDADVVIFNGHPFKDAGQVMGVVVCGQEVTP